MEDTQGPSVFEGHDDRSPRAVLRRAFEMGYFTDAEAATALDALEQRNLLSHAYDEVFAEQAVSLIKERYAPMLEALMVRLRERRERG